MTVTTQAILLGNTEDHDGMLVLDDGRLFAVLCRLSATHDEMAGQWFIECGFGLPPLDEDVFDTLDQACASITRARAAQTAAAAARIHPAQQG